MLNLVLGANPFGGNSSFLIILVLMMVMMYFMVMRPQKKQQQKHQEMVNQMKKGDQVVTIGGLHGVIDSVNNDTKIVVLDCDGVYLKFNLSAIRIVEPTAKATETVVEETVDETKEETK
ncbi:preprotein translocase subunit YajC [Latilactobacillus sakei]|uniref:preprotein translocase subunit YajC n=1 Tax=Latilactobacillus sakei TaxID=1599 RepID=UPI00033678D1|nr:preprotein translocase subunit YajC [Latilactobacillus sakei]EOR85518.1 preprotein translocase, YajC subunit [Latilactobacillus sakei subsp. sakei LS25]PKX63037.1 preprotein translocase subunit YajC [Latilactobacillus sakei]PKX67907.1 preprotein translocase subunit YajC [Latilactobacillus sakei]